VYFVSREEQLIILLAGGDKQSQTRDIQTACNLARSV
jgi:putative addiction module killer protein